MIFDANDWAKLATLFDGTSDEHRYASDSPFFCDYCGQQTHAIGGASLGVECPRRVPYAGYKPDVVEAPNGDAGHVWHDRGDGTGECSACGWDTSERAGEIPDPVCPKRAQRLDAQKRYIHIAPKYLAQHLGLEWPREYLARGHYEACRVAEALGVPAAYYPRVADGTLRVLDYPVGAGTAEHKDPDLFSIVLYRSTPKDLVLSHPACDNWPGGSPSARDRAREISPGLHIGELGELIGLGPATPHSVPARPYRQQSIVYFAMPDHAARLPGCVHGDRCGCASSQTVGEWLKERMARSRYEVK